MQAHSAIGTIVSMETTTTQNETIGLIGAGRLGVALARTALRAGRRVIIANSRGPESLGPVVADLGKGAQAGTVVESASCDIVALAVPWARVPAAVSGLTWGRQIVIDATNAVRFPDLDLVPMNGRTSSEIVADLVSGARVVKAANTLSAKLLAADPRQAGGNRVLFVSGDDFAAKQTVTALFSGAGFFVIDVGGLVEGGSLYQAGGPLARHNLLRIPDVELSAAH